MIVRMTKYSWLLLSDRKEDFIGKLKELGVVDITRSVKPVDAHSEELLSKIEEARALIKSIENGEDAHLAQLCADLAILQTKAEQARVWGQFDRETLDDLAEKGLGIRFFSVPAKKFDDSWAESWPLEVISRTSSTVYFVVVGADDFPMKPLDPPEYSSAHYEKEIRAYTEEIESYRMDLKDRKDEIPGLKSYVESLSVQLDTYLAELQGKDSLEGSVIIYEGFAPSSETDRLCGVFDNEDLYYICEEATVQDNPPIKLKNNRFVKLFEPITDMYGRPAYDSFDPTPFISIFFLLFFAMCMGDMGYGLLLVAGGFLLKKVKSFASFAPLVTILGIGTTVIGFLFHTFFSIDFIEWDWIPEWMKSVMVPSSVAGYDGTMVLALAVGIVHLCLAMIVRTVNSTRNKGFLESLGTWGWTLLFTGAVATGIAAVAGVIDRTATKIILISLGIICAIGIFPLNNIHRKPLVNIGSGLWDTYNMATGILGDVLSYLRLYALGLAGAMLGYAFNDLARMALGDGGARWIAFILIVIVGHTLNLAMAALGAFVHPLRLNFLEFFKNSEYDASGRAYRPLGKKEQM